MRRRFSLILAGNISLLILSVSVISLPEKLIWNRTDSAPIGLYWPSSRQKELMRSGRNNAAMSALTGRSSNACAVRKAMKSAARELKFRSMAGPSQ